MTLSAAERQRRSRDRKRRGGRTINLEITDWQTWVEILREEGLLRGADSPGAVAAATTKFIFEVCREHCHETAEAQLAELRPAVTGIMKREEPRSMEEWRLYAAKDKTLPVKVIKPKNVRPAYKPDPEIAAEIALDKLMDGEGVLPGDEWDVVEAEALPFEHGMGVEKE